MSLKTRLRLLQIALGVVLFLYSAELVIEQLRSGRHGHSFFVLLLLGTVEAAAALVFLFNASIGGPALLATIAAAALVHILHGQAGHVGVLLVYAAAVIAVMGDKRL